MLSFRCRSAASFVPTTVSVPDPDRSRYPRSLSCIAQRAALAADQSPRGEDENADQLSRQPRHQRQEPAPERLGLAPGAGSRETGQRGPRRLRQSSRPNCWKTLAMCYSRRGCHFWRNGCRRGVCRRRRGRCRVSEYAPGDEGGGRNANEGMQCVPDRIEPEHLVHEEFADGYAPAAIATGCA